MGMYREGCIGLNCNTVHVGNSCYRALVYRNTATQECWRMMQFLGTYFPHTLLFAVSNSSHIPQQTCNCSTACKADVDCHNFWHGFCASKLHFVHHHDVNRMLQGEKAAEMIATWRASQAQKPNVLKS